MKKIMVLGLLLVVGCGVSPPGREGEARQAETSVELAPGVLDWVKVSAFTDLIWRFSPPVEGTTLRTIDAEMDLLGYGGLNSGTMKWIYNAGPGDLTILPGYTGAPYPFATTTGASRKITPGRAVLVLLTQEDVFRVFSNDAGMIASSFTPTLTIDGAAVVLDAAHDVDYSATISIAGDVSLAGDSDTIVTLLCDSTATPSTFADAVRSKLAIGVGVPLTLTSGLYNTVRTRVKAGDACRLAKTSVVGSTTATIIGQVGRVIEN